VEVYISFGWRSKGQSIINREPSRPLVFLVFNMLSAILSSFVFLSLLFISAHSPISCDSSLSFYTNSTCSSLDSASYGFLDSVAGLISDGGCYIYPDGMLYSLSYNGSTATMQFYRNLDNPNSCNSGNLYGQALIAASGLCTPMPTGTDYFIIKSSGSVGKNTSASAGRGRFQGTLIGSRGLAMGLLWIQVVAGIVVKLTVLG